MQKFSREEQLLLEISRLELSPQNLTDIQNILQNKLDWNQLLKTAQNNGVVGLLYFHLRNFSKQVPLQILEQLAKIAYMIGFYNLNLFQQLKIILMALKEKQLPIMLFKGAFLIEHVFKDLTLRHMGDLDILIHKKDFYCIDEVLTALGFTALEHDYPKEAFGVLRNIAYVKDDLRLDLHWHLLENNSPFNIDLENLWAKSRTATIAGCDVSVLSLEDLIVFLCLHGIYNHYMSIGLKCFCDIGEVVGCYCHEINWGNLIVCAINYRMAFIVLTGLQLTEKLFPGEIPPEVLKKLEAQCSKRQMRWLQTAGENFLIANDNKTMETSIRLKMLTNSKNKMQLIYSIVFPPLNQLAYQYSFPQNSIPGYLKFWPEYLGGCLNKIVKRIYRKCSYLIYQVLSAQ
ncbi:MAG: nucleotidyltransferase family protein [Candidatus Schekmanbacteria bacterium]|nr:nucleotidyltransferase family protein [Candidatus Schekmanbacteria bacterium]